MPSCKYCGGSVSNSNGARLPTGIWHYSCRENAIRKQEARRTREGKRLRNNAIETPMD